MELREVLKRLESAGTAQNRKTYARHGVRGECYGVSYVEIGRLQKSIGIDHALALSLWKTGNHDARVVATRVADPARASAAELSRWAEDLDDYVATDALANLAGRTDAARALFEAWTKRREEWISAAGWTALGVFLGQDGEVDDGRLERALAEIEARIHRAPNRTRHAMLMALIAIGAARPGLRAEALATAKRIGPVEIDHGETSCKTPDVATYMSKIVAHRAARAAKKPAAAKKIASAKKAPAAKRAAGAKTKKA